MDPGTSGSVTPSIDVEMELENNYPGPAEARRQVEQLELTSREVDAMDVDEVLEESAEQNRNPSVPMNELNYFNRVPDEIIRKIFTSFEINERPVVTQVCSRFSRLLTDGKGSLEDVGVINIFEMHIYDQVRRQQAQRKAIRLEEVDELEYVFHHILKVGSVKIWYESTQFATEVVEMIARMGIKMNCLDVYPYSRELVLDDVHKHIPHLAGLTMRPHGQEIFFAGVDLPRFPNFEKMTTLILESFRLTDELEFPPNLTTLEFINRNNRDPDRTPQYMMLMAKLARLKKLEYLAISHVHFGNNGNLAAFLRSISVDILPSLKFLVLKYSKFAEFPREKDSYGNMSRAPNHKIATVFEGVKFRLQMLKLDLCQGDIPNLMHLFTCTAENLQLVILHVTTDVEALLQVNEVASLLESKQIWLHLGLLCKDKIALDLPAERRREMSPYHRFAPSQAVFRMTSKVEASFVDDPVFFEKYLCAGHWRICNDVKLISCTAADNRAMAYFAQNTPQMRRLSILGCPDVNEDGVVEFIKHMDTRRANSLKISWRRARLSHRPAAFYLMLRHRYKEWMEGKEVHFQGKTFSDRDGEEIIVWNSSRAKTVTVRDYTEQDISRLFGIAISSEFARKKREEAIALARAERAKVLMDPDPRELSYLNRPGTSRSTVLVANDPVSLALARPSVIVARRPPPEARDTAESEAGPSSRPPGAEDTRG